MTIKTTAIMLLATALPFTQVSAHTGSLERAPVTGYMYFMLAVGAAYSLFLLFRTYRRKQNQQINSSNNKN
jgi:NADH:ubiquinone oxidoreductase subunit K